MSVAIYYLCPLFLTLECVVVLDPWIVTDPTDTFGSMDHDGSMCGSSCGLLSVAGLRLYSSGSTANE